MDQTWVYAKQCAGMVASPTPSAQLGPRHQGFRISYFGTHPYLRQILVTSVDAAGT